MEEILKFVDVGEASYKDHIPTSRLVESSKMLPYNKSEVMPKPLQVVTGPEDTMQTNIIKPKNDVADSLRFVDYNK